MKRNKKALIVVACILLFANIPPFTSLFEILLDERHYRYSNYNGSLTFTEFMSRGFEMMNNRHKSCLVHKPNLKDKQIYRLFTKNPLAFWRWGLYFFDERFKLPYKSWEEIRIVRAKENIKEITGCPMEF